MNDRKTLAEEGSRVWRPGMKQLGRIAHEAIAWQRKTFPHQDVSSTIDHLREEVEELARNPGDPSEIADCFLLLLAIADRSGVDLAEAAEQKLAVCRGRTWEEQSDGSYRHVQQNDGKTLAEEGFRMLYNQKSEDYEWPTAQIGGYAWAMQYLGLGGSLSALSGQLQHSIGGAGRQQMAQPPPLLSSMQNEEGMRRQYHEEKYSERLRQETTYYDYRRQCWERIRGWRRA